MVRSRPFRLLLLPVLWSHALGSPTKASHRQVATLVGEDCELLCSVDPSSKVLVLQWSRPDLDHSGYLLFYRHPRVQSHYQHPDYRARVQPKDPRLDQGELSLILKNVTHNDTGTYECRLLLDKHMWRKTTVQLVVMDVNSWSVEKLSGVRGCLAFLGAALLLLIMILCIMVLKWRARQPQRDLN